LALAASHETTEDRAEAETNHNCYLFRIATELGDVRLDPLERQFYGKIKMSAQYDDKLTYLDPRNPDYFL
jgi:hypothetical protein